MINRLSRPLGWIQRRKTASAVLTGEFPAKYYDDIYADSSEYGKPYYLSRYYFAWTVIADRLRRQRPNGVLEVGCGSGQLAALLMETGIRDYVGFDFSPVAIEMAQRNSRAMVQVADGKTTDLFVSHSYDTLICTEVLEHIDDDLGILRRVPVGVRCICTVPSFPYESHVRHFEGVTSVQERYEHLFEDFDVFALRMPENPRLWYYLFEGRRR